MGLKFASKSMTTSDFYCKECGSTFPLPRKKSYQREKNHTKHLYCVKCKCVQPHLEKRACDIWKDELEESNYAIEH